MSDTTAFVVVDLWRAKPGKRADLEATLADSARVFRGQPGVLSVDYTHLAGDPERYLVVFRYANQSARDAFLCDRRVTRHDGPVCAAVGSRKRRDARPPDGLVTPERLAQTSR